ncbi:MAG: hemolysin III family protein [Candidatus Aminicenantes bacterium]|nr:hemolysin III family protein [Candidatus Aminicenantes bacterium]
MKYLPHAKISRSEIFSVYSHLCGVLFGLFVLILLVFKTWGIWDHLIVCLVYGLSLISLFTASSSYHALKEKETSSVTWRKLDHTAIFILIAGTYTPIAYIYLDGTWRWVIITSQWIIVACGIIFKFSYIHAPRIVSPILYLLMGWMALIPIRVLLRTIPTLSIILLVSGGVSYSIGALIYAIKKPNPKPGYFGFHEIFHIFVLLGAVLHFLVVYLAI